MSLSRVVCVGVPPEQAAPSNYRVSALQAFWPAVQAAVGDEKAAQTTYDIMFALWGDYGALPDFYDPYNDRWVLPQHSEQSTLSSAFWVSLVALCVVACLRAPRQAPAKSYHVFL